ncbi:Diacylglycerol kinase [Gryllus bimaculatus]|nr:Diacylglycerol kinase [Gryllus bimaculatus]
MGVNKEFRAAIFDEIDLTDLSFAEGSIKNANHSFQVITPFRRLVLCAASRRDMEEWIGALKAAAARDFYEAGDPQGELLSGRHRWYAASHARPTYCNVCREALSGE